MLFPTILSQFEPDKSIVILDYGHDASHACLRNEKLHTPSIRVRITIAKHTV